MLTTALALSVLWSFGTNAEPRTNSGDLTIRAHAGDRVLEFDFPALRIGIAEYPDGRPPSDYHKYLISMSLFLYILHWLCHLVCHSLAPVRNAIRMVPQASARVRDASGATSETESPFAFWHDFRRSSRPVVERACRLSTLWPTFPVKRHQKLTLWRHEN